MLRDWLRSPVGVSRLLRCSLPGHPDHAAIMEAMGRVEDSPSLFHLGSIAFRRVRGNNWFRTTLHMSKLDHLQMQSQQIETTNQFTHPADSGHVRFMGR